MALLSRKQRPASTPARDVDERRSVASPAPDGNGNGNGEAARLFDPPNSFLADAIFRHKLIVAVVAILGAAAGLAYGLHRSPTYTATASLQVGQVNPNSPGFLGYTQSASSLAAVFSQAIAAEPVLESIDKEIGVEPGLASGRLSSEPIPTSPTFRVIATGATETGAIKLANSAAKAVEGYVDKSNNANPEAESLLQDYHAASVDLHQANARLAKVEGEKPGGEATELVEAEAKQSAAKLRAEALGRSYIETVSSQAPRQGLVSLVAGATSTTDDHHSKAELYAFIGLLAGVVVGSCMAGLVERLRRRRLGAVSS